MQAIDLNDGFIVVTFAPSFNVLSAHPTIEDAKRWIRDDMDMLLAEEYVAIIRAKFVCLAPAED